MARHIVARTTDIPPGGNKVVGVEGAGHSIQGDRPVELASILSDFLFPKAG